MNGRARRGSIVEWSVASAPLEGGESGDEAVVVERDARALLVAIDGLGHGPEAALAARCAAEIASAHDGEAVIAIVERCHEGLRHTRGVAMTVVAIDVAASSATWTGVGNVDCVLVRAGRGSPAPREAISLRGGVVGYRLPPMHARSIALAPGDTFVLATDGIRSGFTEALDALEAPAAMAESILERHGKGTDDALVLVARYLGGGSPS
jgi:serine phosphatase RsbU (regulator of sigma subunit)